MGIGPTQSVGREHRFHPLGIGVMEGPHEHGLLPSRRADAHEAFAVWEAVPVPMRKPDSCSPRALLGEALGVSERLDPAPCVLTE